MDIRDIRGPDREKNLAEEAYFSANYFALDQLCSFAHQINDIHLLQPSSIIEVGVGNGFTSSILRRAGFDVVTADINPNLKPDYCISVDQLTDYFKEKTFDLVVCCEVLEHLPFEDFEKAIEKFSTIGSRLYLSLPNFNRTFGFSGFVKLPKLRKFTVNFVIDLPLPKKLEGEHFWEVGSKNETTKRNIEALLRKYYRAVSSKRFALNPYHLVFMGT